MNKVETLVRTHVSRFILALERPFLKLPLHGRGVEVGVCEGYLSIQILRNKNVDRLFLVDPYLPYQHQNQSFDDAHQKRQRSFSKLVLNLAGKKRHEWIYRTSVEAASLFTPASLDFVYLDGDHSYESVKADIAAWWPKVRLGGYFGGHDFDDLQVKKAVTELTGWSHYLNVGKPKHYDNIDWYITKDDR